ncbi:hypothetical protein HK099_006736 [Clydaea vesicula]|uniref:Uncharacterized protein n=1 Tax=Clydaea vesicula TaxID=447962 RepID=A0AAD5U836_9FUNG|nr:hypothetical protein HK099_006736 [Clydaea vesicula]
MYQLIKTVEDPLKHEFIPPSNIDTIQFLHLNDERPKLKKNHLILKKDSNNQKKILLPIHFKDKKTVNKVLNFYPRVLKGCSKVFNFEMNHEQDMYDGLAVSQKQAMLVCLNSHRRTRKTLMSLVEKTGKLDLGGHFTDNDLPFETDNLEELSQENKFKFPLIQKSLENLVNSNGDELNHSEDIVLPKEKKILLPKEKYSHLINNKNQELYSISKKKYSSEMDDATRELKKFTIELQQWVADNLETPVNLFPAEQEKLDPCLSEYRSSSVNGRNDSGNRRYSTLKSSKLQVNSSPEENPPIDQNLNNNNHSLDKKTDFDILLNAHKPREIENTLGRGASVRIHASSEANPPLYLLKSLQKTFGIKINSLDKKVEMKKKNFLPDIMKAKENKKKKKIEYGSWYTPPNQWSKMYNDKNKKSTSGKSRRPKINFEEIIQNRAKQDLKVMNSVYQSVPATANSTSETNARESIDEETYNEDKISNELNNSHKPSSVTNEID